MLKKLFLLSKLLLISVFVQQTESMHLTRRFQRRSQPERVDYFYDDGDYYEPVTPENEFNGYDDARDVEETKKNNFASVLKRSSAWRFFFRPKYH